MTDDEIGEGYYSLEELQTIAQKYSNRPLNPSFVLIKESQVVGVRLTLAPGQWDSGKGKGLSPNKWNTSKTHLAYFQSLFIKKKFQKLGWGKKLSQKSLAVLKEMGAQAVLCHSWVESPGDSSRRYLKSLGFESLEQHPTYWKEVNYVCPRCGKPCVCTAEEMILKF